MEKFGHDANSCPLGSEYKGEVQINSNGGNVVQVCRKETSQHPGQLKISYENTNGHCVFQSMIKYFIIIVQACLVRFISANLGRPGMSLLFFY